MIGVDEVGRGCLAGPLLVVAARATADLPTGLKDSKQMSRRQREEILDLLSISCEFGEGWVAAEEIDKHGLADGLRYGLARALFALKAVADDEIIYDGPINYAPPRFARVSCVIDADARVPIVSAASIYAKVKRDQFMSQLRETYPDYGFENHVGYGTPQHRLAINKLGPIAQLHRLSFSPFRQVELEL
jgi:ribonuclease HII